MESQLIKHANNIIDKLRTDFSFQKFKFEMSCSSYLSGDINRKVRQAVIYIITQEERPLTKCTLPAVTDALTAHFAQPALF